MPVNPVIRTLAVWQERTDPLVQQIQDGPTVVVLMADNGDSDGVQVTEMADHG